MLAFVNGKSVDRIVGFEGLGYTQDTFTTKDLEGRLLASGVVQRAKAQDDAGLRWAAQKKQEQEDEDYDEWD